jgi:starch-binding outer membrane protein, SusD/RagB family
MKKINLAYYIFISFLMFSCGEEFLDLSDPTRVTSSNFYKNKQQIEQTVNGIYSCLQTIINEQWLFNELPSDNTTVQINPSNRFYQDRQEAIEFWTYSAATPNFGPLYSRSYNALYNINFALDRLSGADIGQSIKDQYEGELKFIRAYLYFNLVQQFGPVVLLSEPLASPDDAYGIGRSPEEEVYNQIITDLTEAATLLPRKQDYPQNDLGRATKGSALSLLGKTYLTLKDYSNAEIALREVIQMSYSLLNSYADVFDPVNKNHNESIFEIQFQGNNDLGEHSSFMYTFAPWNGQSIVGYSTVNLLGFNIPTNNMINAFEEGDLRKDIALQEGFYINEEWKPVPYINKYNNPHSLAGRTNDNWPVIRYSDVLLMLAEAINEQNGPNADAYEFINAVRQRAGLEGLSGLDKNSFREAVLHERRVELCFENHRWFDLKRTMTQSELVAFLNAHGSEEKANPTCERYDIPFSNEDYIFYDFQIIFPIPEDQVELSEAIEQNPGY